MKMDEYDGKRFLATVRGENFAHAGEAEAIDLVFSKIPAQPTWKVMDVGCGRGGTAMYVCEHGWGEVTGVDIDEPSIQYAQQQYPGLKFVVGSMESVGQQFPEQFDLLYLFNVFYASLDKRAAMVSLRKAAKPGGMLCIFDYVYHRPEDPLPAVFLGQRPASPQEIVDYLSDADWELKTREDLDQRYIEWYSGFLKRFDDPALSRDFSSEVIDGVREKYSELLSSLETGVLGGVLILAQAC